jgi:hypothetical protein
MDHISGVVPLTQIGTAQAAMQPFSAAVTTWVDTKRIITTVYKATLAVADLQYFDLVAKVVGAATSKALGRTHVRVSYEPDPPPTLPDYGAPFDGASEVDDLFTLLDERPTGRGFRGLRTTRKLYAKVRSEDSEDPNNIHEAEVELTIIPTVTVTGLNVLVRNQQSVMRLEELPVVDGAYEIMVGDLETIGVMLQPTGTLGEQAILRGRYATYDADPPTLQPIQDVVTYNTDAAAAPFDVDDSASLGVFGIDRKADLLAPMMGIAFRRDYPTGLVQFIVDATSTDSLANTIQRSFKLRSVTPQTLTEIKFSYVNSRNPNDICLIRNNVSDGGDVNGVITGAGTFDDPYIIPVDMPEQFQAFAMAQQLFATSQAWVQTGYAFGTNPVDIIYPATPAAWKRAFDRSQRVGVVPHPVAPGTATLRPPTMAELMEASFGTPVGDPGTEVGYTGKIKLYARGQSLANELNVVEKTIVIRLADPTVLAP